MMELEFFGKLLLTVIGVGLFSFMDRARPKITAVSCVCGGLAYIVGEIFSYFHGNGFVMYFLSASVVCICSESAARILRTPSTVILLPAIIPLVPGSLLYTAMGALMKGEGNWYTDYGKEALYAASGIGLAIVVVAAIARLLYGIGIKVVKMVR